MKILIKVLLLAAILSSLFCAFADIFDLSGITDWALNDEKKLFH